MYYFSPMIGKSIFKPSIEAFIGSGLNGAVLSRRVNFSGSRVPWW